MSPIHHNVIAAATVALLAGAAALIAGPLTPPGGPVGPTYKTLSEVQPARPVQSLAGSAAAAYVIDQPGSYYLTGNITAINDRHGIDVVVDNVTIDLCGFTLDGAGVGYQAIVAGTPTGPIRNLSVVNGVITNWYMGGIFASEAPACIFENLRFHSLYGAGLQVGPATLVRGCVFNGGQTGIYAEAGVEMVDCSATGATSASFWLGDGCSAMRCTAYNAVDAYGFYVWGANCAIQDCNSRGGFNGIRLAGDSSRVQRCKISRAYEGIVANVGSTIIDNTLNSDGTVPSYGIMLFDGQNRVEGNHLYGFGQGIGMYSNSNVVLSNTMHACTVAISPPTPVWPPLVAPVVNTAAAVAANPVANIAQ